MSTQWLPSEWEEVACILCGNGAEKTMVCEDVQHGHLVHCRGCGLVYRSPRRTEDYFKRFFQEQWTEARSSFYLEDYRKRNFQRIVQWILGRHPAAGSLLDVGSSYGTLLAMVPDSWRRLGVEPSGTACQTARERLPGATIINSTLAEAEVPPESLDVITMIDMVYHLPDPVHDFRRVRGFLQPEGLLLVESWNFANRGLVYRLLQRSFPDFFLYFYTPETLTKMLHRAGIQVVARFDLRATGWGPSVPGAGPWPGWNSGVPGRLT